MAEVKKSEKKKGHWTKLGDIATYVSATGTETSFDLSKLPRDVLAFYGGKQVIADKAASEKTEVDRIAAMKEFFDEAVEKGLELTDEGKVRVIGKARKNAAPRTQDNVVLEKFSTMSLTDLKAMQHMASMGILKLSEGLSKQVAEKVAELEAAAKKGKK